MKYKWKEQHFRELLSKDINEYDKHDINCMIDILHDVIDLDFFGITNNSEHDTFMTRFHRYHDGCEYLDENLIQFASSIFSIEKNECNLFTYIEDNEYKLSNEDLIEFAYEILKTLNNKYVLTIFNEIYTNRNNYLHICESNNNIVGTSQELGGLTIPVYNNYKSYIVLFRNHTITDLQTLVHELLHAVRFRLFQTSPDRLNYFDELEGRFGNRLTYNYLLQNGYKFEGDELLAKELYGILYNSYMLYLNNALFYTADKNKFRLRDATNELRKRTKFKESRIRSNDIDEICSINCFTIVTEIIDYLICLELSTKYNNPEDEYHKILELKKNDNYNYYHYELYKQYDFYNDKVKALKKEKKYIDKFIQEK